MRYLLLFLISINAYSGDSYFLRGGPSIENGSPSGSSKIFSLRREVYQIYGVSSSQEIGGFVDNSGQGHRGSIFGKYQLGITPGPDVGTFGKAFLGPCVISHPDSKLGSIPQFCTDLGFGVRGNETSMSINYMHISNAGIFSGPNKGRDFLVLEMGFNL